ncbi:hypothetical protein D3C77_479210 [compost metagenome]
MNCTLAQREVKKLAPQASGGGYLAHASCIGSVPKGTYQLVMVTIRQHLGKVLTDRLITIKQRGHVECTERQAHDRISLAMFLAS